MRERERERFVGGDGDGHGDGDTQAKVAWLSSYLRRVGVETLSLMR